MNVGCKNFKKGDIIKGLLITVDPYKVMGDKNYRSIVKCTLCNSNPYEIVLSEINRHVFDGCGCQKDRSNSVNWLSFKDWCEQNKQQHLLDTWDYDLNKKTPDKVSSCTSDYYYFKCPYGKHESSLWKILSLTRHGKVKTVCKKCNSFAQFAIDKFGEDVLDIYWDYDKNTANPWEVPHATKDYVWIKCINLPSHGSYRTRPHLFLKGIGCPTCADEQKASKLQDKVSDYISNHLHLTIKHERKCSIIAINPKNGYRLPYDNDVVVDNSHLIIEVHGVQHYDINNGWICKIAKKLNVPPKQVLEDLQWRDEYKKQYALSQGYYYLAIPYWTESDESYKTFIDQKIQEIINNTKLTA
jgi:hypothetical protein